MWKKLLTGIVLSLVLCTQANADVLFGECGCNGAKISTSYNSQVAYVKNGKYQIEYDGEVNRRITVYLNGKNVGEVTVKGATKFHIDCKK